MVIDIDIARRRRRFKTFKILCAYYRGEGCTMMEAARFARQTLDISPPRHAKVLPYGPPSDLPH